jgi:hypothetical protein
MPASVEKIQMLLINILLIFLENTAPATDNLATVTAIVNSIYFAYIYVGAFLGS